MERKEALNLLKNTQTLFNKHDEFSCVSDIIDPLKVFSSSKDKSVDETSKSFQLDFMYDMTMYSLSYTGNQLKLIDFSEGHESQKSYTINSFPDIINQLEKEDKQDGESE